MRRIILVTVALTLLAAGCGKSGTSDLSGATTAPASKTATTTTKATTTAAPTTPKVPAYRLLSQEELTGALLGVQDLPAGYSQDPPGTDNTEKTFCDYKPPFAFKVKARQDFTKGGGMSAENLSLGLRQYASTEEAKAAFGALTDVLASCTGETYQGAKLTYAPMSAPKVGDASVGVKINADGTDLLQIFALVGPTLINTGGGGLMNASADDVNSLLETQVKAYQAAAAQ
ncbi:MAG: hypothetical protein ACR2MB_12090 [Acidimicrobiales bacterium]